jgi:ABC-2 type transport system ATP-binding protein
MTIPSLQIANVSAGYGKAPVISDISLEVASGETFGLIGLNGAGKTTLIKTILGLKDAMSGSIQVEGHAAGTSGAQRHMAYLPERFDPAWFLNAYEFINFTLSLYGRKTTRAEVDAMADGLGLKTAYLPKRAQTYSKGMRQKVGLMTTFLTACPLLILDEPMSGLDPLARAQVKGLMTQARTRGQTIFMCSHILSDMEELCDRIAVMHAGRLVFVGRPADLLVQTGQTQLERAFLSLTGLVPAKAA